MGCRPIVKLATRPEVLTQVRRSNEKSSLLVGEYRGGETRVLAVFWLGGGGGSTWWWWWCVEMEPR